MGGVSPLNNLRADAANQEAGKRPPTSDPPLSSDLQGAPVDPHIAQSVSRSVGVFYFTPSCSGSFSSRGEVFAAGGVDEAGVSASQLTEGPAGGVTG